MLEGELDSHLDYAKQEKSNSANARGAYFKKS